MRPLAEQVVVLTGASSGIGRETALRLGTRGATVVLAARGEGPLHEVATEVRRRGGRAHVVVTDVADWDQVYQLAMETVARFGRIDTWINNAAVSTVGSFEQLTIGEIDRVLAVDLMGAIYGAKAALDRMIPAGQGTIITVASVLGERAVPLMSMYCAAKHGVVGFMDALRLELARDHPGIAVSTIFPAAVDTPFYVHARSKVGAAPQPYPPVYAASAVAEAIVFAAERPRRRIHVGAAAKALSVAERIAPRLVDRYFMGRDRAYKKMLADRPPEDADNLFVPVAAHSASSGGYAGHTARSSLYTRLFELRRGGRFVAVAMVAVAALGAIVAPRLARSM